MSETYEELWDFLKQELMPKKCKGCECGEMTLNDMEWEYVCELEECYHTLEETTNV